MKEVTIISKSIPSTPRSKNYPKGSTVINNGNVSIVPNGTNNVDIVKKLDSTIFTDSNVLSSLRTLLEITSRIITESSNEAFSDEKVPSAKRLSKEISAAMESLKKIYLSKTDVDTASEVITFIKGLKIGGKSLSDIILSTDATDDNDIKDSSILSALKAVGMFLRKDKEDTTEFLVNLLGGIVTNDLKSKDFTSGQSGSGLALYDKDGKSYLEVDELLVRLKAVFAELEIRKLSYVGGNIILSSAGSKITRVEETSDAYRCYFIADDGTTATTNGFVVGDQARCQTFNIKAGKYTGVANKYYWRLVMAVSDDYIELSKTDCDGTDIPAAGDSIVQMGSRTNIDRQNLIEIVVTGDDAPAFIEYAGVNTYSLEGKRKTILSPKGDEFIAKSFKILVNDGAVRIPAERGEWIKDTPYSYYDRVSHSGSLWLCIIAEGKTTADEPVEGSTSWQKQVSKGSDGTDGKDGAQGAKGDTGAQGIQGLQGLQGEKGDQGIPGTKGDTGAQGSKGDAGQTSYFHVKYSDYADGTGMNGNGGAYIGTYVDFTLTDSTDKTKYTWVLVKGAQGTKGDQGIAGANGANGQTSYLHIAYAYSADGKTNFNQDSGAYIGQYVDFTQTDSSDYTKYNWTLIKGAKGDTGETGSTGAKGDKGDTGATGATGAKGDKGDKGTNGNDGYSCSLTSYSTMLNSDLNGVIGSLVAAMTTVKLYQGSTAVTPAISIDSTSNCSASISGLNVSIVSVPNNTKSGYVDIKVVYGSFVKIERYTFTVVDYTVVKNYTQTIVGDQMSSYATKSIVDALGNTVSDQSTTIKQNSDNIALKASKKDVSDLGDRMTSAEAKITPDAINLTVKSQVEDIALNAAKRTSITIDASSLDVNTYYPILIGMNSTIPYTITVERTLDKSMGVPSYSTHESGFSVFCKWTSNGSGWGTIDIKRVIHLFQYRYTANNIPPIGSIGQMTNHSLEFIYVRGGSKYNVLVEGASDVNIQLTTSAYTTDYPTYTQTINLLTSVEAPTPDIDQRPTFDEIKSQFTIDTDGISMLGKKITLTGMVSFKSLSDYNDVDGRISAAQNTANNANNSLGTLTKSLGNLAYKSQVEQAMKDEGLISGGFLKMTLIDVKNVVAQGISAQTIDAGNATLKNLTVDNVKMTNADVTGKITAQTGTIGALRIDGNKLTNEGSDSDAAICLWNISNGTSVRIGENVLSSTTGMMSTAVFQNNRKDNPNIPVLACGCEASGSRDSNIGLYINATGATQYDDDLKSGNHAIYIPTGNICGFRPRGRSLSYSQTLDDMDCIIFTKNTNTITLTLPSSPQYDQFYFIKRCESGGVNINAYPHSLSFKNYNSRMTTWSPGWQGVFLNWDKSSNMWWASLTVGM